MFWRLHDHLRRDRVIGLAILALVASDRAGAQVRQQFGVPIPMRDGVTLAADVWMPEGPGPFPTIVVRTPYLRTWEFTEAPTYGKYYANHGYVWVMQDVRGRGDSEGTFAFFRDDGRDGYDTIEWIAAQPWSDGRVGTMGVSYLGTVQWLAARERPPHLECMASTAAAGRWFEELPYLGGALQMLFILPWTNGTAGRIGQSFNASGTDWDAVFRHRPLLTMDEKIGRRIPTWREFVEHATMDDYWKRIQFVAPRDFVDLDVPVLHIAGLFDWDQPGALFYWDGMRDHAPARDDQYLLLGPWTHPQTFSGGQTSLGEWQFAENAIVDYKPLQLAFFDYCLKDAAPTFDFPRARVYMTGRNEWMEYDRYPPQGTRERRLYLQSEGRANSLDGDGRLTWTMPDSQPPDRYTYDPENPTPSSTGLTADPRGIDHRSIERRDDVLVYTSEVLDEALTVVGRVFVHLQAASDAPDTDFTAKLLDVQPDGRALKLGPTPVGVLRARYRNGYERPEFLTPNEPEHFRIELFDVAHTFLPGHRIRLEVASAAFPAIDANTNTGKIAGTDTTFATARQVLYHDPDRPSWIELPVIP